MSGPRIPLTGRETTEAADPAPLAEVLRTPRLTPASPALPEWLPEYIERAEQLGEPHGPDCPCFMDASIRAAIGHAPMLIDPWDLFDTGLLTPGSSSSDQVPPQPNLGETLCRSALASVTASCVQTGLAEPGQHRTVRVISSFVQVPRRWQADAKRVSHDFRDGSCPWLSAGTEAERTRRAAETAALLGVPVGLVTRTREEAADAS